MTLASKCKKSFTFKEGSNHLDCYIFDKDTPLPDEAEMLSSFFEIWKNKIKGSSLPAWKDFDFTEFKGWHSNIRVMKLGNDIKDKKVNMIVGETFQQYWGQKTIYEQVEEGAPPSRKTVKKYYQYLEYIYNHHYSINIGSIPKRDGSLVPSHWIELPLANDGKNVTHLLTALLPSKS